MESGCYISLREGVASWASDIGCHSLSGISLGEWSGARAQGPGYGGYGVSTGKASDVNILTLQDTDSGRGNGRNTCFTWKGRCEICKV